MRQHLEIKHRIGIGGKGTGAAIFLGLMLVIGLVWVVLAYLDGRKQDYEERIVGALKFLNWTIAESRELDAKLYAPSLKRKPEADHWVLSGVMVIREDEADQAKNRRQQLPFSAHLQSVCANHGNPNCWRLAKLVVDGQAMNGSQAARSDDTGTPQGRVGKITAYSSAPKEPASRIPPEFPVAPWITAARPHNNMPVPFGPPCVEEGAWRDPDMSRNRQLIVDEAICVRVIEFTENDLNWRVQVFDSGRPGYKWVVLHDDEDAAFDSALYAIVRYGGKVVDVDLLPPTRFAAFVDPNRNFAVVDAQRQTCDGPRRRAAPFFASTILELLGSPPYLALHNNHDGHLLSGGGGNISVHHSTKGLFGLPANKTGERLADEDNFILVSGLSPPDRLSDRMRQMTDKLRYAGVNVIYEHVRAETYDCSLSNFLLLHGGAEPGQYFNVEAELGDYRSQITMIDALVGALDKPLRASH